jgi:pilus assembly protein CpaB
LLRRAQTIVLKEDDDTPPAPAPTLRRGPRLERRSFETVESEPETAAASAPQPEAEPEAAPVGGAQQRLNFLRGELDHNPISKGSPQSLEALRAQFQRTLHAAVDEPEPTMPRFSGFKFSRILLIAIALVAGSIAVVLALSREPAPAVVPAAAPAPVVVAAPAMQVLVATKSIGMGERLDASSVAWQDWPESGVQGDYITSTATPEAIADMSGSIARFEIFAGEPIRAEKLVRADQGYLSAVLAPGMRGVSVPISADQASGGFIVPNDHVDVVLTRDRNGVQVSDTILVNVRVVAINARLGETGTTGAPADPANPRAELFADKAIATLELDQQQSEAIINAMALGNLSLVLRSIVDFKEPAGITDSAANRAIRLSSPFWTSSNTAPPG